MSNKRQPSPRQAAILEAVKTGRGNLAISAVAGSGKTTTLMMILAELVGLDVAFLSFSNEIKLEIQERVKAQGISANVQTINSLGFGAVMAAYPKTKLESGKYFALAKEVIKDFCKGTVKLDGFGSKEVGVLSAFFGSYSNVNNAANKMRDLSNKMRVSLAKPCIEAARAEAFHHDIDLEMDVLNADLMICALMPELLKRGKEQAPFVVDFTDQLWLPATMQDVNPRKKYDFLLVDECQDLSKAQLACIKKAIKKGGRAIFVGDPNQAIFGFAGADVHSFDRIVTDMNCTRLPLDVCYRCPTSHIALAQAIVPEIQAAPNAIEGTVEHVSIGDLETQVQLNDLILCRTTAPLVELCFSLLTKNIPARIKGRDIGKRLISLAEDIFKDADKNNVSFVSALSQYERNQRQRILEKNGGDVEDSELQSLADRCDVIRLLWVQGDCKNIQDLEKVVDDLFSDTKAGVMLSTAHRAKGLEADRVFLLRPELMPLPFVKVGSWQYQQEVNLFYVSLTRSKASLLLVDKK